MPGSRLAGGGAGSLLTLDAGRHARELAEHTGKMAGAAVANRHRDVDD